MDFQLSEEQRLWRKTVHDFVKKEIKPLAQEINEHEQIPPPLLKKMGPLGLLGMSVPEEFGGAELDAISSAIAIEEIAWGDGGTALTVEAHNELGCAAVSILALKIKNRLTFPRLLPGKENSARWHSPNLRLAPIFGIFKPTPKKMVMTGSCTGRKPGSPMLELQTLSSPWQSQTLKKVHGA